MNIVLAVVADVTSVSHDAATGYTWCSYTQDVSANGDGSVTNVRYARLYEGGGTLGLNITDIPAGITPLPLDYTPYFGIRA
jgi:hypothetical protein